MAPSSTLGEFEHLVLLAVLGLGDDARAISLREEIAEKAERSVTRGGLYTALERLEAKGLLSWKVEASTPERGGLPRRVYSLTPDGLEALRSQARVLQRMTQGVHDLLHPS